MKTQRMRPYCPSWDLAWHIPKDSMLLHSREAAAFQFLVPALLLRWAVVPWGPVGRQQQRDQRVKGSKGSNRSSPMGTPAWIVRSQYLMTHAADDKSPSKTKMHTEMVDTILVPVDPPLWQWATAHLSLREICPTGGSLAYFSRTLGLAFSWAVTRNVTVSTSLEPRLWRLDTLRCYDHDDCVVFFPIHHHDHKTFPGGMMHFKKLLQNMGACGFIFPRTICTCNSNFASRTFGSHWCSVVRQAHFLNVRCKIHAAATLAAVQQRV